MTRQTSIDAYRKIESEGLLSKRRFEVYSVLFKHGPLTTGEVWWNYFKDFGISQNSINPRMSELVTAGVVCEVGTRECSITGQTCIQWDVTANLPIKYEKPKKIKCEQCKGKGYHIEQQAKLF